MNTVRKGNRIKICMQSEKETESRYDPLISQRIQHDNTYKPIAAPDAWSFVQISLHVVYDVMDEVP